MQRWFDRSFASGLPAADAPGVFARMRSTVDRLDGALAALPAAIRVHRPGGRWSIQEHAGHLLDLESLLESRLDDYDRGAPVLRAADLENRRTHEARHNERAPQELSAAFRQARTALLARLEAMSAAQLARVAVHPRLQQPMSVVDLCYFVAEHDDHHLQTMADVGSALAAMPACALELANTIDESLPRLEGLGAEATAMRPAPGKWSPREIVGHLVDSASNNHQRFVRAMFQDDLVFPGYEQDRWVQAQRYQDAPWPELLTLWASFNRHLARVMAAVPTDVRLKHHTRHTLHQVAFAPVAEGERTTLDFFMRDYVAHLRHHLRQIPGILRTDG